MRTNMYTRSNQPWWSNWSLIAAIVIVLIFVPRSPAFAQESTDSVLDELVSMVTPRDGGIPESYFSKTPYTCDIVSESAGENRSLLGDLIGHPIFLPEPIVVLPGTESYFDPECKVLVRGIETSIPASILLGYIHYRDLNMIDLIIEDRLRLFVKLKYSENRSVERWILALDRISITESTHPDFELLMHDFLAYPDISWYFLQMRQTDLPIELMDESTSYYVPIARTETTNFLILTSGLMVPISFICPEDTDPAFYGSGYGSMSDGSLYCNLDKRIEQVSPSIGLQTGRYSGIYFVEN